MPKKRRKKHFAPWLHIKLNNALILPYKSVVTPEIITATQKIIPWEF